MKQAVIAPSMLYLLYPLNGTVEGYPKEEFVEDLVNEVRLRHNISKIMLMSSVSVKKIYEVASKLERNESPSISLKVRWMLTLPRNAAKSLFSRSPGL